MSSERPDESAFGALIATRRAALRLSLRALAQRAEMDPTQLSRIERGILHPPQTPDALERLGLALELDHRERLHLSDLAALANGSVPADIAEEPFVQRALLVVTRALRDMLDAPTKRDSGPSAPTARVQHGGDARSLPNYSDSSLAELLTQLADSVRRGAADLQASELTQTLAVAEGSHTGDIHRGTRADTQPKAVAQSAGVAASMQIDPRSNRAVSDMPLADVPSTEIRIADAQYLQTQFDALLRSNSSASALVEALRLAQARAVVFGGWARDHLAANKLSLVLQPADLDIVVEGLEPNELGALLEQIAPSGVTRNAFNGFVFYAGPLKIDIWTVQTTHTFVVRGDTPNLDLLPWTTVFTVESIIFKPRQWWIEPTIVDGGFYESVERRMIDLQKGERLFPEFQLGRALQYAEKLGFKLSPQVLAFAQSTLYSAAGRKKARDGVRRFGHPDYRKRVLRDLREIEVALSRGQQRRVGV